MNGFGLINMSRPKGEYEQELRVTLGRVYDPKVGRFLSPDPILQNSSNTQNMNRYSYVWNNPLKYVDPSGYYNQAAASIGGSSETGQVSIGTGNWYGTGGGGSIFPKMGTLDSPTSDLEYDIALAQSFDGILGGTFYMDAMRTSVSNGYYNRGSVQELSRSFVYTNGNFTGVNIYYGYVIDSGMSADASSQGGSNNPIEYLGAANDIALGTAMVYNALNNDIKRKYAYKLSKRTGAKSGKIYQSAKSFGKSSAKVLGKSANVIAVGSIAYDFGTGTANTATLVDAGLLIGGTAAVAIIGTVAAPFVVGAGVVYGVSCLFGFDDYLNETFDISGSINFINNE